MKASEITRLFKAGAHDQARTAQNALHDAIKGQLILDDPEILSLHLDLEFLTHEEGTIAIEEVDATLSTLRNSKGL